MSSDGRLNLAFVDGADVLNNSLNWYHDTNFENSFLLEKKKDTCPTIMLEKTNSKVNVKMFDVNNCKGACTKVEVKEKTSIVKSLLKGSKTSIINSGILNNKMINTSIISNIGQIQKKLADPNNLSCTDSDDSLLGNPNDPNSVAWLVQKILNYIKIIGPILVIIFSSIDYLRALVQSDNDTLAKLHKKLLTRIVLVLLLFFVPTIVNALLALFGFTNTTTCNLE